ncbi:hypothetical protein NDU88_001384 [Pleurodeles waltl]|uniref:Uncharacterized protein n=1 Tax=Pleurodeles waltl TaxID=8319 RepID=A0AAV7UU10_PLEWA|nr:hypothetical protein NDU88_001384 [Pleurodeles waltl]
MFTPALTQVGKEVELFETLVEMDIQRILRDPFKPRDNLTSEQRNALRSLQEGVNITIKPADKGGGVVIFDTRDYEKRAEELLSVKEHYQQVPPTRLEILKKGIGKVIGKGLTAGWICEAENPISPAFYRLP